ncbi:MAG: PHP domain-containing protein, partial [Chloroflexi bacterium]|nr:PHP domain-containing protein [Chloroflexota bacterium]
MNRIDLHMHSTASDGVLTPAEVVHLAQERGLTTIALTDPATTTGWGEALAAGRELGVEVLGGFEINSETDLGHIDFLVYGADAKNAALQDFLLTIRDARVGRARGMVRKLAELGMPITWERVLHFAGDAQSIARPHVARALVEAGYAASTQEAFDKYLNDQGPAYVHRLEVKPQEVIETVHQAGGVIVLSSPEHSKTTHLTPTLAALGLDGIEVYYFDHADEKKAELKMLNRFLTVARQLEGELPAFEPARKNDKILSDNDFL